LPGGGATIDEERCKRRGHHVMACPNGAIALRMHKRVDAIGQFFGHIGRRADIVLEQGGL